MALPEEFLERLKQSNDIVSAMSGYAQLKKAGRDFVCLCPFHSEKTASCHIYTDSQSFYCFGCGAGGDVITFTRLTQNLDYMGAVRLLADRSGIAMPDEEGGGEELRKRSRIYEMNAEAAKFFRDLLLSETGKDGIAFLHNRGLTDNTIRKYGLGYAPDSWNALKRHMNSLRYSDVELVEASLLKLNENGKMYDMFRGRVMFPIIDRTGKIIAFSGRLVNEEAGFGGKYVNSSETPVYRKGENLFSINFAKNSKKTNMILCEGNIDAVMLNQAGFDNAVAILGTALTPAQARLLRFYCEEVVIAYDSDAAGEKATVKAINLLNREGLTARVLQMDTNAKDTSAKDPDDYIKMFGADSFAALIEKSGSAISFEMDKLKKSVNLNLPEGRAEYLKKAVVLLSQVENNIDRMVYVSGLARDCDVTVSGVQDAIESAIKSKRYFRERDEKRSLIQHGVLYRQNSVKHSERKADVSGVGGTLTEAIVRAECGIIAFLFHSPDKLSVILKNLSPGDFPTAFNRRLFETLILRLNKRQSISISSLGGEFSVEEVGRIEKIKRDSVSSDLPFDNERLADYINVLVKHKESENKKPPDEMTNEELLEYTKSLKDKKTVKA